MINNKVFKILAIGNSFSDNATKYLYQILKSFGVQNICIGNLFIGGCTIQRHLRNSKDHSSDYIYRKNTTGTYINYDNKTLLDGIKDEEWDYVTMQQASHDSGILSTYTDEIEQLIDYGKKNSSKKFHLAWHMTWSYQGDSSHPSFGLYQNSPLKMYGEIVKCVQSRIVTNPDFETILPVATAIQNARTSYLGDTFTIDGFHLEPLGEFIAGVTWIMALTKWSFSEMNPDYWPQEFRIYYEVIRDAVENAILHPFSITISKYQNSPFLDNQPFDIVQDVKYNEHCTLDIYLPKCNKYDLVVHFHGGGLIEGSKNDEFQIQLAQGLINNRVACALVNYRLYPQANYPDFYNDAKDACNYIINYKKEHSQINRIYVSGQSAGAYLTLMLCLSQSDIKDDISGWISDSAQTTTHFNVLKERGLDPRLERIDAAAPIYYVDQFTSFSKLLLISYTRDILGRLAENELLLRTIKKFAPDSNVLLKIYEGEHCACSCKYYRNQLAYTNIILDFIK